MGGVLSQLLTMDEESLKNGAPALTPQQRKFSQTARSPFAAYRELAVGRASLGYLALYEVLTLLFSGCPGLIGFGARSITYPWLLKRCTARPAIGRGVTLRNPRSISFGSKVMVDDYATLDVREDGEIELGSYASIGRFTMLVAKRARIELAPGVNVSSFCRIATQSKISIGESTLIAAYCYIGPGNHQEGTDDTPLIEREMEIKGGVKIGAHAWIGAHTTILDGVEIGEGAIVGAHSLVRSNIPPHSVAVGVPAKVIRSAR